MGYDALALAILKQAVRDYSVALQRGNTTIVNRLEKWFVSNYAQLLSGDMGEEIIRRCKEGCKVYD